MKKLIEWMKTYPIVSFLTLALVFFYIFIFFALLLYRFTGEALSQVLPEYLARLSVYGPVLAGILVTRWTLPNRSHVSARNRKLVFVIVWFVSLIVSALNYRQGIADYAGGLVPLLIFSIPVALLPAFVISSALSRITSIREYLSTLIRPKGNLIWYLVALFTFPVLQVLGIAISQLMTGEPLLSHIHLKSEIISATLITFASVFFFSGGINEESGWRGFAQRHLQAKFNPLITNLLLWVYLVIWHIPNDIMQYSEGGYLLVRIGLYPFITILLGWVYNRTGGSILAPALFHASMNSMNTLQTAIPGTNAGNVLLVLFALFAIFYDRMWKKLPVEHTAVYSNHITT